MSERMSEDRRARIENLLSEGYQMFLRSTVLELTREIDRLQAEAREEAHIFRERFDLIRDELTRLKAEVREKDERINVLDFERQTQVARLRDGILAALECLPRLSAARGYLTDALRAGKDGGVEP